MRPAEDAAIRRNRLEVAREYVRLAGLVLWKRRMKLLAMAAVWALPKLCVHGPAWMWPACEVLAKVLEVLP